MPDDQATKYKKAFAALWTAIADEYGLPSYQYNELSVQPDMTGPAAAALPHPALDSQPFFSATLACNGTPPATPQPRHGPP